MWRIAAIPGDGIGVDVTREALKVLGLAAELAGTRAQVTEWPRTALSTTCGRA
jgi:isocitrate/isopropylmalate dehydrogenase